MEEKQINEGNATITNSPFAPEVVVKHMAHLRAIGCDTSRMSMGEFDCDWNLLMEVVVNICKTKFRDDICEEYDPNSYPYLRTFGMIDHDGNFMVRFNRYTLFMAPTLLQATYEAVVDFIVWYNAGLN